MDTWWSGKNEPKTNPNEPKFKKAKMNVNKVLTKDYEKKSNWDLLQNEPKTNPNKANFKGPIGGNYVQGNIILLYLPAWAFSTGLLRRIYLITSGLLKIPTTFPFLVVTGIRLK